MWRSGLQCAELQGGARTGNIKMVLLHTDITTSQAISIADSALHTSHMLDMILKQIYRPLSATLQPIA